MARTDLSNLNNEFLLQIGLNPCGWCGRDGMCTTHLFHMPPTSKSKKKSIRIDSNCLYHYQGMNYVMASKTSDQTPCTNIPLTCPMCPQDQHGNRLTFWKYNFLLHMSDKHIIQDANDEELFANLHPELVVTTRISCQEERKMEIPSAYTDTWRKTNNVPDSDAIEAPDGLEEQDSRKRGISDASQTSMASRQPSPSKKHRQFYGFSPQIHVVILRQ